jgi:hypothetical protein
MSRESTFSDTEDLSSDIQIDSVDIRYVDLYDFYELGFREFKYVLAEIVESPVLEQITIRLLIPFENAEFEPVDG